MYGLRMYHDEEKKSTLLINAHCGDAVSLVDVGWILDRLTEDHSM